MADIRINSLPTTATSTSFDDYVAVDGSGNGTRKLSAYSPTFGGNLTVSGTATSNAVGASLNALGAGGQSGYLVSDGHLIDLYGGTSTHFVMKRAKNTSTQNRWGLFMVDGEVSPDSGTGSNLSFRYAVNNGAWTEGLKLDRTGNATLAGNLTVSGNVYGGSNLVLYGTTGATGNVYLRAQGAGYVRVDTGSGFRVESGSLDVTAGSLTVSGTGTSTFTGDVSVTRSTGNPTFNLTNGASGGFPLVQFIDQRVGGNNWNIENGRVSGQLSFYSSGGGGTVMSLSSTGNLTVSGTGNGITIAPTAGAANLVINGAAAGSTINFAQSGTNKYTLEYVSASNFWSIGRSGVAYDLVLKSGNLLLGTTTDSGNGKLQLATHTTSAGGIGFGTDISLYRGTIGGLALGVGGGVQPVTLTLYGTGNRQLLLDTANNLIRFSSAGGAQTLSIANDDVGGGIILKTNGSVTALTLDSSQNATFANGLVAGKTSSVNTITGGDAGAGTSIISFKDGLGATKVNITGDGKVVLSNTAASTSTTTGALTVSGGVGVAGAVNVGGAIAIGNTVQTAASVASTHKVTVVIGGVTYYLLATNI